MQIYREYQPTEFDSLSNFVAHSDIAYLADWFVVPCGRNRESSILDQSNFDEAVKILGGESETVEIHRFGHWACGWYEIILAHPSLKTEVEQIEKRMDNYPVLNEDDYSAREFDAACELWESSNLRDRLYYIERYSGSKTSIFAARRVELPQELDYSGMVN